MKTSFEKNDVHGNLFQISKVILLLLLVTFSYKLMAQTEPTCSAATGVSVLNVTSNAVKIGYALPAGIKSAALEVVAYTSPITDATVWTSKDILFPSTYTERTDLLPGTKYVYRIKTVCGNGTIKYTTNGDFVTPTAVTATCAPTTNVSVSNITQTSVTVNFKLPADVKLASLELLPANSSAWISKSITDLTSTSIVRPDLTPSTKYSFKIKTSCTNGSTSLSNIGEFTTLAGSSTTETCTEATALYIKSVISNAVKIGYTLPSGISSAQLQIVTFGTTINDATVWLTKDIIIPSTYTERVELLPGTKYIYRVKTVCNNGTVKYSVNGDFTTPASVSSTCSAATNVSVSNITSTGVTVNFKLPSDVTSASLEVLSASSSAWMSKPITNLTATSIERLELTPSTKYSYKIKTTCANGATNLSAIGEFTTAAGTGQTTTETCSAASSIAVKSVGSNAVKIGYALPSGISSAILQIVTAGTTINDATVWLLKEIIIPSTYTERGDLLPATKYVYRVKTVCTNGTVKYTDLGDFTTTAATTTALPPCSPATNISVTNITTTSATFKYTLPTGVISATLEVIPANSIAWLTRNLTIPSTSYDRNELILATKYYYRIRTVCPNGTVSYSPEAYFLTLGNKNGALSGSATSAETGNDLTVSCFPNPATSGITVNILGGNGQLADLQLSNIYGKVVFQSKFPQSEIQNINVGSFPRGIYVMKVTVDGKTSSLKIVLN